jgi:hypothetical protein
MATLISRWQPDLHGTLQIACDECDLAAHLTVSAKPFKRDERRSKAIEEESDDVEPLLVHSNSSQLGKESLVGR